MATKAELTAMAGAVAEKARDGHRPVERAGNRHRGAIIDQRADAKKLSSEA